MNHVLALIRAARASSDPQARLCSDQLLSELLYLHEEMITQLCVERLEAAGNVQFLTDMIAQHEATAALLRSDKEKRDTLSPFVLARVVPELR